MGVKTTKNRKMLVHRRAKTMTDKPCTKKNSSNYVKKNFGDVITKLSSE